MNEKLKPCPFCGSSMCQIYRSIGESVYVRCNTCNSTSGIKENIDAAIKAWNRRAEVKDK